LPSGFVTGVMTEGLAVNGLPVYELKLMEDRLKVGFLFSGDELKTNE